MGPPSPWIFVVNAFPSRVINRTIFSFVISLNRTKAPTACCLTESGNRTRATLVGGECSNHCATTARYRSTRFCHVRFSVVGLLWGADKHRNERSEGKRRVRRCLCGLVRC